MKNVSLFAVVALLLAALSALASSATAAPPGGPVADSLLWRDVARVELPGERLIIPNRYRTVAVEVAALDALLASAPREFTAAAETDAVELALPLPDGAMARFRVVESPVMAPELAAKFPQIRTYVGQGIDQPAATLRLDRTPAGFHAMILSPSGSIFIDPYQRGDVTHYISYRKHDLVNDEAFRELGVIIPNKEVEATIKDELQQIATPSGPELRTYRVAIGATGEYTQFHGGTVAAGMAAIVTTLNRVVGIYEQEVAIRMELVANNDLVVFTNPVADPYENDTGTLMLVQNQVTLDALIGPLNYDIGHVFSTGGGGVAFLGVVCYVPQKAGGVTGRGAPVGDPFDVDYVAHEMGHQFGGNHTFNGTTGSCSGNRNASAAMEPGSGSTIQAYAGICGAEDLQPNSDPYFHAISYDEIVAYTHDDEGDTCPVITQTGNNPPVVAAGPDYTIPAQSYFELTGSATDPDGDTLTYNWEEFDTGAAAPPNTDNGNRPIFRSFNATLSPTRTFPKLTDILSNTISFGESLPTTTRNLTFRLTVRDNRAGSGGVDFDSVEVNVSSDAGPFLLTSPNDPEMWSEGNPVIISWDVAGTDVAPVSCAQVDILLSTDGGLTFPMTLASATANDGSETVTVPAAPTTTGRIKVKCSDNIFFDISDADLTIEEDNTPTAVGLGTFDQPVGRPWPLFLAGALLLGAAGYVTRRRTLR